LEKWDETKVVVHDNAMALSFKAIQYFHDHSIGCTYFSTRFPHAHLCFKIFATINYKAINEFQNKVSKHPNLSSLSLPSLVYIAEFDYRTLCNKPSSHQW
jgi:hypothetical protein